MAEQAIVNRQASLDKASYGTLIFCFGILPIVGLALLGGWIGARFGGHSALWGRGIGAIIGFIILVCSLISFMVFERRQRMRGRRDVEARVVEELSVSSPRAIEILLINDNEPIVAFDIGGGKILFLQGQWLCDPSTYIASYSKDDPSEEFLNGLPEPNAFPSTEFIISRLPHSGVVLGIQVKGHYLPPEKKVDALREGYEFGDSEIFTGELDHIAEVLAAEHSRRFPTMSTKE